MQNLKFNLNSSLKECQLGLKINKMEVQKLINGHKN